MKWMWEQLYEVGVGATLRSGCGSNSMKWVWEQLYEVGVGATL